MREQQVAAILLPSEFEFLPCAFKLFLLDPHVLDELGALLVNFIDHVLSALTAYLCLYLLHRVLVLDVNLFDFEFVSGNEILHLFRVFGADAVDFTIDFEPVVDDFEVGVGTTQSMQLGEFGGACLQLLVNLAVLVVQVEHSAA